MTIQRVLIVDPDRSSREALLAAARALGLRAQEAPGFRHVRERLASSPPDVLLIDAASAGAGSSELRSIREQHPDLPVVLLTGPNDENDTRTAAAWNGCEALHKSCSPEELEHLLERVERGARLRQENEYLRAELLGGEEEELVARSAEMAEAVRAAARSARSRGAVLITGEPGTGRRRLARHIHLHSPRRARAMIRVSCAEISPAQLEARLFGAAPQPERAVQATPTLLELADGGTLLLEEVSLLSCGAQERLLAALERGSIEAFGSSRSIASDVRVIATNRSELHTLVSSGRFSPALHRHLSPLAIHLRPLRERAADVMPLAELFAAHAGCELGRPPARFSSEAERRLLDWSWPGNARELECVVRRAMLLAPNGEIGPAELALQSFDAPASGALAHGDDSSEGELARLLTNLPIADIERIAILATLESSGGNKTEAARRLGLTARTLSNKLKLWRGQGLVA